MICRHNVLENLLNPFSSTELDLLVSSNKLPVMLQTIGFCSDTLDVEMCKRELGLKKNEPISIDDFCLWAHFSFNRIYLKSSLYKLSASLSLDESMMTDQVASIVDYTLKYADDLKLVFRYVQTPSPLSIPFPSHNY